MQQGGNQEAEPSYVQSPNKVLTCVIYQSYRTDLYILARLAESSRHRRFLLMATPCISVLQRRTGCEPLPYYCLISENIRRSNVKIPELEAERLSGLGGRTVISADRF